MRTLLAALLVALLAAPADAGSGRGTISQTTSLGGSPPSYRITVNSTADVTVGDHVIGYVGTTSGVWLVTAKTATTITLEDSLTEANDDTAFGAPKATAPYNLFAWSTPSDGGMTLPPDLSLPYASAALRRNAFRTSSGDTQAHAFVGADHTGAATAAAARATLDLEPGTDVQAQDAALQAVASITSAAAGELLQSTGYKGWVNRTLSSAIDAAVSGSSRGDQLVRNATVWTRAPIGAAGRVWRSDGTDPSWTVLDAGDIGSGQLAVARGGTGAATASANQVFSGPTGGGAAAPAFRALVSADLPSHTHAAGSDLTGQVPVANGGTGAATAAANLLFAGPTSGGSAAPSFRAVVAGDLPAGLATLGAITTATHGHLFVATAQGAIVNLAPGSNDQVLTRDSTQPLGVKWAAAPGGSLATTLGAGNTTGGTDLVVSDGDVLGIGGSSSTYPGMSYAGSAGEVFVGRADGTAGSFKFFGVPGSGAGAGSPVSIQGGAAVNANAGAVNFSGGDSSNGNGGNAFLSGGSGGGSSSGGGVTLTSGAGGGGDGVVTLATPEGTKLTATTGVGVAISGSSAIDTTAGDSATINRMAGRFRKDASGATFTLTNSLVTASSIVILTMVEQDATATVATVAAGSGSFVVTFNAAPTATLNVNFMVIN